MSTKFFYFDGGLAKVLEGEQYKEGAALEFVFRDRPTLAIQAWHGLNEFQRAAITARLAAAGWIEGEQSKSDVGV